MIGILRAVEALRTFVGVTCVKSVEVGIKYGASSRSIVGRGWKVPVNLVRVQLGRSVGGGGGVLMSIPGGIFSMYLVILNYCG